MKVLPSPIRRQNYEDGLFTPQSANDSYRSQESKLTNLTAKSGMLNYTGNSRSPAPPVKSYDDGVFTPQSANDSYRSQESKLTNSTAKSGMLNFTGNSRAPAPPVKNFVDEIDYIEDDAGNSRYTREFQQQQFFENQFKSPDGFEEQYETTQVQHQRKVQQTRTVLKSPLVSVAVILQSY